MAADPVSLVYFHVQPTFQGQGWKGQGYEGQGRRSRTKLLVGFLPHRLAAEEVWHTGVFIDYE